MSNSFIAKKDCCGCAACINICPKHAISLTTDENGFSYPIIDGSKCINCGLCKKVCSYKYKNINNNPIITYAGATLNNDIIKKSSSGGIFGTIAYNFLKNGCIVYGCSLENENSCLSPQHIRVDNISDLYKLLGSKYVQSQMGSIYLEIKNDLLNNKKVLFSGTPCQVHSLQSFLEETRVKTDNLFSVDLICHGTPSTKMFQDYIIELEKRKHKRNVQNPR